MFERCGLVGAEHGCRASFILQRMLEKTVQLSNAERGGVYTVTSAIGRITFSLSPASLLQVVEDRDDSCFVETAKARQMELSV